MPGPLRESHRIGIKGPAAAHCCCWSGSYKILIQEPPKSLPQELFVQAPLRYGICKIFMQGPRREDLTRISTRSSVKDMHGIMHEPLREEFIRISTKSSHKDMHKITQGPLRCQQDLHKIFWEGPVIDHASTSDTISSGSAQHLLTRIVTRPWSRSLYIMHHETLARAS